MDKSADQVNKLISKKENYQPKGPGKHSRKCERPRVASQVKNFQDPRSRKKQFDFRAHTRKLVRLLNEKKIKLVKRIRYSMGKEMVDFEQTDCERWVIHANEMPAYRFVPDKPTSRAFVTFTVYDEETKKKNVTSRFRATTGRVHARTC